MWMIKGQYVSVQSNGQELFAGSLVISVIVRCHIPHQCRVDPSANITALLCTQTRSFTDMKDSVVEATGESGYKYASPQQLSTAVHAITQELRGTVQACRMWDTYYVGHHLFIVIVRCETIEWRVGPGTTRKDKE